MIRTSIKYDLKKIHKHVSIYILKKRFLYEIKSLKKTWKVTMITLKDFKGYISLSR